MTNAYTSLTQMFVQIQNVSITLCYFQVTPSPNPQPPKQPVITFFHHKLILPVLELNRNRIIFSPLYKVLFIRHV